LVAVSGYQFIEGHGAGAGIGYVGRHGSRLVGRPHRASDKAGFVWGQCCLAVSGIPGQQGGLTVNFIRQVGHAIVGQRNGIGVEGVGFNDVGTGSQVGVMDFGNDSWFGEAQQIVVSLQIAAAGTETFPAKVGLVESAGLYHSASGTVQHQYALPEQEA